MVDEDTKFSPKFIHQLNQEQYNQLDSSTDQHLNASQKGHDVISKPTVNQPDHLPKTIGCLK